MNVPTGTLNFQQTPLDIMRARFESRMYDHRNTRGPFFYGQQAGMPTMRTLGGLRGLGAGGNDVSALASAMTQGQIQPAYIQKSWTPGYTQTPEALPSQLCAADGVSQQIASLLGGSVVSLPAQNLQGVVPNCNWIELPSGDVVRAADIVQIASITPNIWGKSTLCGYAQLLMMAIPNSTASACETNPVAVPNVTPVPRIDPPTPVVYDLPVTTPVYTVQPTLSVPRFGFVNLTSGQDISNGGNFRVGDSFAIQISGASPNAPVTVTAVHDGVSSTTILGNTSPGGSFQSQGMMDPHHGGQLARELADPGELAAAALTKQVQFAVAGTIPVTQTQVGTQTPVTQQYPAQQQQQTAQLPAAKSDNTLLFVGLGAAALFLFARGR